MKRFLIILLFVGLSIHSSGQITDVKVNYELAFDEMHRMLRGETPLSFKRAVFLTENAYLENQFSYEEFQEPIDALTRLTKAVVFNDGLDYKKKDRQQVLLAGSIYRVMKDTLIFENPENGTGFIKHPYTYDTVDFWGAKDWTKMFVVKLLSTQTGNCHSLPILYKILADELGAEAWLSITPNHTYIKQWNDKTGWYNTELTSGRFPYDAEIKNNSYIKTEAIVAGVYMDTLTAKENISYAITDLAQGFIKKFGYDDIITPVRWLDTALIYYPDYPNALILRAELLKKGYEKSMTEKGERNFLKPNDPELKNRFEQLEKAYFAVHQVGYRRMPKEMYLNWLYRVRNDTTRKPHKFESPQPFKDYGYKVLVMTASDGFNYEFYDQEEVARIGTVEINRLSGRIVKFIDPEKDDFPDDVISRMYDPYVGRFWTQDRFAETFHSLSPYQYAANNPITNKDVNGDFIVSLHYKMTYDVLKKYGYSSSASSRLAWYSSMYADNPSAGILFLNNMYALYKGLPTVNYAQPAGWDTKRSQDTKSPQESMRHAMTGDFEDPYEVSPREATRRGQEFGWSNIFKAADGGTPDQWKRNSKEYKAFGVGIHALQDSKAHQGVKMKDHDLDIDMAKGEKGQLAFKNAMSISESAVLVVEMLNGNFSHIQDGTTLDVSGMNKEQFQKVLDAAIQSKRNIKFVNE
jgi:RHS repeat-associated protein